MGVQMITRVMLVMSVMVLAVGCATRQGRGPRAHLTPIPQLAFSSVRGVRAEIAPARAENGWRTAIPVGSEQVFQK
ncbi:MAG TPA: hypothetical protein VK754_16435 [Propionibacteriaceae bacterium]|nr:hypothetical protein [Propionibacteriaceae bacterium]